jgi:hypothetical protein
VSSSDEPEGVILREGDEYDALRHDYLQGLYEKIVFTGDLDALAAFIREGGDIERIDFREIIPDLIEADPKKNPGGAQDADNIAFYIAVEARRRAMWTVRRGGSPTFQKMLSALKKTTKEKAISEIAMDAGLSNDGGDYRHRQGKNLFFKRFGREWN